MTIHHRILASPIGPLTLVGEDESLTGLYYPDHRTDPDRSRWGVRDDAAFRAAAAQLGEYFAGERTGFSVALALRGSEFRHRVWRLLGDIPHGETTTYRELAVALGRPGHARAVGSAVRANPVSIIVPCHRVLGSSGALTGYAGGLERKRVLLALEQARPPAGGRGRVAGRPRRPGGRMVERS